VNAFQKLLSLGEEQKRRRGVLHTASEIAQQPRMWRKTVELVIERGPELGDFLRQAGVIPRGEAGASAPATVILSGAGSSEYVGRAAAPWLRRELAAEVRVCPSTDLVTHPRENLAARRRCLVVHFARSGNSPESEAAFDLTARLAPQSHHLCITCNANGRLAEKAREAERAFCLLLPEETNDRSLVMTSSFSSMVVAAVGLPCVCRSGGAAGGSDPAGTGAAPGPGAGEPGRDARAFRAQTDAVVAAADRILGRHADDLQAVAARDFGRAIYLGSGSLHGIMQECRLKMLEMTEARVAADVNTYLGLRHGPQVFVNGDCLVVAALAADPYVRGYEIDLLRELREKKQGGFYLVVCDRADDTVGALADLCVEVFPQEKPAARAAAETADGAGGRADGALEPADALRGLADLVVGQLLATYKCLELGLQPDNPSTSGTISRVVQGVRIQPFPSA